ncbi:MAG TPA: insulinase family protein [Holophagaceae bacterium]|nr:insulinase family protein [Holophagaceae bacterium]
MRRPVRPFAAFPLPALMVASGLLAPARASARAVVQAPVQIPASARPQTFTLPNGLEVALFEDHSLPLVKGELRVALPPPAQDPEAWLRPLGLGLMALGGSGSRSAAAFAQSADALGLQLPASLGPRSVTWRFTTRTQDQGTALDLLADRVARPAFDPLALEPARLEAWSEVGEAQALPLARLRFERSLAALPLPGERQLASLDPTALAAWHRARFRPEGARLALWGDLDLAQARQLALLAFGAWTAGAAPAPAASPAQAPEPGPFLAALPGEASEVRIGLVEDGTDAALRRYLEPWVRAQLEAAGLRSPAPGPGAPLVVSADAPLGTPAAPTKARLEAALEALPATFGDRDLATLARHAATARVLLGLHPGDQLADALAPAAPPPDLETARAALRRWLGPANRRLFASGDPGALAGLQAPEPKDPQAPRPASTPKR